MMKWEMDMEEIEAILEKIWDLHDKLSDEIHTISRSHFLKSIHTSFKKSVNSGGGGIGFGEGKKGNGVCGGGAGGGNGENGFVFMKGFGGGNGGGELMEVMEAKSLNAIRSALENLEDQLEFFHTVQSQQRAERDTAIARLEQSRIILAMRLSDHHGKKYKVIEEALAFVGDVQDTGRFVSPEDLFESPRSRQFGENHEHSSASNNVLIRVLVSSFNSAKRSLRLDQMGGVLGNAALVAVSMLAFLHFHHQVTFKNTYAIEDLHMQDDSFNGKNKGKNAFQKKSSSLSTERTKHLDVFAARG